MKFKNGMRYIKANFRYWILDYMGLFWWFWVGALLGGLVILGLQSWGYLDKIFLGVILCVMGVMLLGLFIEGTEKKPTKYPRLDNFLKLVTTPLMGITIPIFVKLEEKPFAGRDLFLLSIGLIIGFVIWAFLILRWEDRSTHQSLQMRITKEVTPNNE